MDDAIYFPILRAKAGEIEALGHLAPQTMTRVRPLLDVPKLRPKAKKSLETHFVEIVRSVATTWGTRLPLYLDLSLYEPETIVNEQAAVEFLFVCARQLRLQAIPVAGPEALRGPGLTYLHSVRRIAKIDGRGAAVRFHYSDLVSPALFARSVAETLDVLDLRPGSVDLYLDLEATERLPSGVAASELAGLAQLAIQAIGARSFRNVVLCASSVPEAVGKKYDNVGLTVERPEMRVWEAMVESRSAMVPRFGDYGIVYAHETEPAKAVRVPARLRYSTPAGFHLYRANRADYRQLARVVRDEPGFYSNVPSWGLLSVRACADGYGNVGGPKDWVARDTNQHIERTSRTIEEYLAARGLLGGLEFAAPSREPWLQNVLG